MPPAETNLRCVIMEIDDAITRISILQDIHKTRGNLEFERVDPDRSPYPPPSGSAVRVRRSQFSAYFGRFAVENRHFLVFASRVSRIRFGKHEVYKAIQIVVYELHSDIPDMVLSESFTEAFANRVYFSYSLDLTQNIGETYSSYSRSSNPFFLSLANLQALDFCYVDNSWFVPAIVGQISPVRCGNNEAVLLYKESCFGITPLVKGDLGLLSDFYSPTSLNTTEFVVFEDDKLKVDVSYILSGFPGIVTYVNEDNEKLSGSNFNPQRIYRFIQFFNEFFGCTHFMYSRSDISKSIFRKLSMFTGNSETDTQSSHSKMCSVDKFIELPENHQLEDLISNTEQFARGFGSVEDELFTFHITLIGDTKLKKFDYVFKTYLRGIFANPKFNAHLPNNRFADFLNSAEGNAYVGDFLAATTRIFPAFEEFTRASLKKHKTLWQFKSIESIYPKLLGGRHFISHFIERAIKSSKKELFTTQELKMAVIIHNCAGTVPESPGALYYLNDKEILDSDLIIIGLQEIVEMKSKNLQKMFTNDNSEQTSEWDLFFEKALPQYFLLGSSSMLGLMTLILVKKTLGDRFEISLEKSAKNKLGFMNLLANKGFLALRLKINHELVLLANCHFQAGNTKDDYYRRIEHLKAALAQFESKSPPRLSLVFGDMNFRTDVPPGELERCLTDINRQENEKAVKAKMLQYDQLTLFFEQEKLRERGINEALIDFMPSYKYIPNTLSYAFQQSPSW